MNVNLDVIRQNTDDIRQEKKPVSLEKQSFKGNDDIRLTDNVRTKQHGKQKTAVCEYQPCSKEFIQTVTWKRFCCDEHRKLNWEATHGKKLNFVSS